MDGSLVAKSTPASKEDILSITEGEVSALSLPEAMPSTPDKSYVPEGFKSVEDYLDDVRETYKLDVEADQDNRDAAIDDKKFSAGEQWDPEVLKQRQGLPCMTIDTISQFTAQVVGDWRQNKIAVKVLPAETGDKNIADIRADLIRNIETQSRAERVYDNAFESMIQCGDGAFKVAVQYAAEDVFDQEIVLAPIDDALSVIWDRLSIDPTGRDATHCFVDDTLPRKEFKARWPDLDPSLLREKEQKMLVAGGWLDTQTVRVTEHWRLIERKKMLTLFKDGSIYTHDEDKEPTSDEIDAHIEKHGPPLRTREAPCLYAQMHLITGFDILSGPYEWKLTRLPVIRMTGRVVTIGDRRIRHGIVRKMKDPMRLKNFWRSVAAEQLGYAPKAKWLAPESAVEGREDVFRKAHLTRDPLLIYNDDAETPPQRIDPPPMEAALLNEANVNTQDMKDVSGLHDASLGIKSNETSGKAIMARQREGDVANITYYDNGNAAVLEAGDVMNQFIGQIYDGTRIIRIIGEDESTKLVNINDPMDPDSPNIAVGKYDVAMSTGASYTTRRLEAADAMMQAIQVYPELMGIAGDLVIKAQDWPGAEELSERLIKTIPPQLLSDKEKQEVGDQPDMQALAQQQAQTGEQLQQAQQELQQLQQENQALKLNAEIEAKKAQIEEYKAETGRLTAYAAIIKDGAELDLQRLEQEAEQALARAEHAHSQNMDAANLVQDQVQHSQQLQQSSEQADADRASQEAQAAQASTNEQASTPPA